MREARGGGCASVSLFLETSARERGKRCVRMLLQRWMDGDAKRECASKSNPDRRLRTASALTRWRSVRLIALVTVVLDARGGRLVEARRWHLDLGRLCARRLFGSPLGFGET